MRHHIKKEVEHCLKYIPETRNSDTQLIIEVFKEFYPQYIKTGKTGDHGIYLKDLFKLPNPESIRRSRQQFTEKMMYLPTDIEVVRARKIEEDRWRQACGYPKHDETKYSKRKESYASKVIKEQESKQEKLI